MHATSINCFALELLLMILHVLRVNMYYQFSVEEKWESQRAKSQYFLQVVRLS